MSGLNASELLMLPWSIVGPCAVDDGQGNRHFEIRIRELPDFFVAGATESEVLYDFRPALLAFLESYAGEPLPDLPTGQPARYSFVPARPPRNSAAPPVSDQRQAATATTFEALAQLQTQ
jgi:hypothetical protein